MEADKNRGTCCTLIIAITGWMIIGGAITYLELRRNVEINALDALVFRLREKVDRLESEIDAMKNNTSYRLDQVSPAWPILITLPEEQVLLIFSKFTIAGTCKLYAINELISLNRIIAT